ncbi:MAG: immunoglobulin domain-containing protein [Phycisphaerales bacterium]
MPSAFCSCIFRVAVCAAAAFSAGAASAQCEGWLPGGGYLGTESQVFQSAVWDPDGAGPQQSLLVMAGQFKAVATEPYQFIAGFDGQRFVPLGDNFFVGAPSLCVHDGELYAGGGHVDSGGGMRIGVYHFSRGKLEWEPVGGEFDDAVAVIDVLDGQLVAGGFFLSVGGVPANRVARWNGASWEAMGSGLGGTSDQYSPVDIVENLKVFQGSLYASGYFFLTGDNVPCGSIARWNGSTWVPLPTGGIGAGQDVYGMDTDGQKLYFGGNFTTIGGQSIPNAASYDGASFASLAGGPNTWVYDVRAAGPGQIVFGGLFSRVGSGTGLTVNRLAKWNASTSTWSGYGVGFNNDVLTTADYQGTTYAMGRFAYSGDQPLASVARWTGSAWAPLANRGFTGGGQTLIYSLGTYQGSLVAGGVFRGMDGTAMKSVGRWTGDHWESLGAQLINSFSGGPDPAPAVYGIAELNGKLYIGGTFLKVGTVSTLCVAQYDGANWTGMGTGATHNVLCLTTHQNAVYFGGLFGAMSGTAGTSGIARWNGTAWSSVGGGVSGAVHAIASMGNDLIVGGGFSAAGGVPASNIARWDGTAWHAIGDGFNQAIKAIAVYNGQIYAGGKFITASGATPIQGVARWNADANMWEQAGYMPGEFDNIEEMAVHNGRLYVCGTFQTVDGVTVSNIARYDGSAWQSLRGGVNADVFTLKSFGGALCVGGSTFSRVGGDTISPSFARWSDDVGLLVASQPMDAVSAAAGSVQFRVRAGGGVDGVSYQWRRNGVPLTDGSGPSGAVFLGATQPWLTVMSVSAADAGSYDCVVTGACNDVTSAAAVLTVPGSSCAADLGVAGGAPGSDGVLNNNDFIAFINYFFSGDAHADLGVSGGLPGHDGVYNNNDFIAFINAFFAGCP